MVAVPCGSPCSQHGSLLTVLNDIWASGLPKVHRQYLTGRAVQHVLGGGGDPGAAMLHSRGPAHSAQSVPTEQTELAQQVALLQQAVLTLDAKLTVPTELSGVAADSPFFYSPCSLLPCVLPVGTS